MSVAERVADSLDLPWDRYEVSPPTTDQVRTLLDLKAGLNHVGMGFILGFFEQLLDAHGPELRYFTGDGGDKTLPDLSPPKQFSSLDELAEYVIVKNSVFSAERAADLTSRRHGCAGPSGTCSLRILRRRSPTSTSTS